MFNDNYSQNSILLLKLSLTFAQLFVDQQNLSNNPFKLIQGNCWMIQQQISAKYVLILSQIMKYGLPAMKSKPPKNRPYWSRLQKHKMKHCDNKHNE